MNNSNKRITSLSMFLKLCNNNDIKPSMYDQVTIEFDESMFLDRVLGNMTRIDDYQENETNLIVVKTGRVKEVLGGISSSPLSNNNVPNIKFNRDGTCTIDMSADWIKTFNITEQDFRDGNKKFMKSAEAASVAGLKKSGGASITENQEFFNHRMKIGAVWLFDKEAVEYYKIHNTTKMIGRQLALV